MPSSTSSSSESVDMSKFDRPLPKRQLRNTVIVAFVICVTLMTGWELYWRDFGVPASYRNSEGLWTIQRRRIDNGEGDKTVLTGSSRVFFNTQLDVWEAESGQRPIQLALEGVVDRYGKETPTQWLGQQISMPFEPYLRFYFPDYALFQILHRQDWTVREGWNSNIVLDVRKLANYRKDRNARLWSKVADNEDYRNEARMIWESGFVPRARYRRNICSQSG